MVGGGIVVEPVSMRTWFEVSIIRSSSSTSTTKTFIFSTFFSLYSSTLDFAVCTSDSVLVLIKAFSVALQITTFGR